MFRDEMLILRQLGDDVADRGLEDSTMTAETDRNKQMVQTYVREVVNRGTNEDGTGRHPDNVDGMLELFSKYVAADAYDFAAPEAIGPQGAVDTLKVMWAAFPTPISPLTNYRRKTT